MFENPLLLAAIKATTSVRSLATYPLIRCLYLVGLMRTSLAVVLFVAAGICKAQTGQTPTGEDRAESEGAEDA